MTYETAAALFANNGLSLSQSQHAAFSTYQCQLVGTNQYMNLTAITEDTAVWKKHFLDSCLPFQWITLPEGASVIDVGTGAGFPGIPMRIFRSDLQVTLLDSLKKRVHFLETVCDALQMPMQCVHDRAELAGKKAAFREQYDVACARAVAALPILCEYCLPFVKVGGIFFALKGPNEIAAAAAEQIAMLGGAIKTVHPYELDQEDARQLIVIQKISATPKQYPRTAKQLQKAYLK